MFFDGVLAHFLGYFAFALVGSSVALLSGFDFLGIRADDKKHRVHGESNGGTPTPLRKVDTHADPEDVEVRPPPQFMVSR